MKTESRPKRWARYVSEALEALEQVEEAFEEVDRAVSNLEALRDEYLEWDLPENLEMSALGEKLQALEDLEFNSAKDEVDMAIQELRFQLEEAEGADLPLGFGRD